MLAVVPFFSHNFNNTSVIPPMITALNIAPFKNSSEGNILLVCPERPQITPLVELLDVEGRGASEPLTIFEFRLEHYVARMPPGEA